MRRLAASLVRVTVAVALLGTVLGIALIALLRQPAPRKLPFTLRARADSARLSAIVSLLTTDMLPRSASHPDQLARAAAYLATELRTVCPRTALQTFEIRGEQYANVVCEMGPESGEVIVVGAHYDAFSANEALPGADDNASGTAGLLELARLLSSAPLTKRVLLVAYANEEPPFFGSDAMGSAVHAASLAEAGTPVHAMICLEMIGYFRGEQNWPNILFRLAYPSRGDFIGVAGGWPDRHVTRIVKRAIAGAGGVPVVSFTGPRETSDASDQRNYWSHGWPAVIVTDTAFLRNPNYHTVHDTAQTLDYNRMARVVDGVASAVLHLASE